MSGNPGRARRAHAGVCVPACAGSRARARGLDGFIAMWTGDHRPYVRLVCKMLLNGVMEYAAGVSAGAFVPPGKLNHSAFDKHGRLRVPAGIKIRGMQFIHEFADVLFFLRASLPYWWSHVYEPDSSAALERIFAWTRDTVPGRRMWDALETAMEAESEAPDGEEGTMEVDQQPSNRGPVEG